MGQDVCKAIKMANKGEKEEEAGRAVQKERGANKGNMLV